MFASYRVYVPNLGFFTQRFPFFWHFPNPFTLSIYLSACLFLGFYLFLSLSLYFFIYFVFFCFLSLSLSVPNSQSNKKICWGPKSLESQEK